MEEKPTKKTLSELQDEVVDILIELGTLIEEDVYEEALELILETNRISFLRGSRLTIELEKVWKKSR